MMHELNTEIRELTDNEIEQVSGGRQPVAMERLPLLLPNQLKQL